MKSRLRDQTDRNLKNAHKIPVPTSTPHTKTNERERERERVYLCGKGTHNHVSRDERIKTINETIPTPATADNDAS